MICPVWIIPKIGSSIGDCLKMLVTHGYLHFHGLDASDKSKDGCVFAKLHLPRLQNHGHLYITKMLSQFIFTGKALRSKIFNLRQQVHICWAASCLKNSTRCTHHYPTWWVNAPRIQDQYISKGTRQKLLSGFFPLKGYTPPPLNGKSPKKNSKKMGQKELKLAFSGQK